MLIAFQAASLRPHATWLSRITIALAVAVEQRVVSLARYPRTTTAPIPAKRSGAAVAELLATTIVCAP
jgi:hypothetical protein